MISRIATLAAITIAAIAPAAAQERAVPPKFYASAAEVDRLLAKAKAEHKGDSTNTNEIIVSDGPYPVQLEYRTGTTPPSIHKGQAELIYVIDGGCTLIEGGTLEGVEPGPGPTLHANGIKGGKPQKLSKGDYVMVPPDTPHWYTDVRGTFVSMTIHVPLAAK